MSEGSEIQKFVRTEQDGQRREFQFAPFPVGPQESSEPEMMIVPLSALIGEGDGELRHLAYDDPPHNMTEQEWRETLSDGARVAVNEEHFVQSLVRALTKDLIVSHGCHPAVAIPAIIEFGKKVYAEVTGTV